MEWIRAHFILFQHKLILLTNVGLFSSMKDKSPVKIVDTDQAGFHVSGW